MSRDSDRLRGLRAALLDWHGDRVADDLETYQGDVRALYAAAELYSAAEASATEHARAWWWVVAVLPALMAVAWWAGVVAGRARSTEAPTPPPSTE